MEEIKRCRWCNSTEIILQVKKDYYLDLLKKAYNYVYEEIYECKNKECTHYTTNVVLK